MECIDLTLYHLPQGIIWIVSGIHRDGGSSCIKNKLKKYKSMVLKHWDMMGCYQKVVITTIIIMDWITSTIQHLAYRGRWYIR